MADKKTSKDLILKRITINATCDRVWQALTESESYRAWNSAFAPGVAAETDWLEGGPIEIKGPDACGLHGRLVVVDFPHSLQISYQGTIDNGRRLFDTPDALQWCDCFEKYRLAQPQANQAQCELEVKSLVPKQYANAMFDAWDKALARLKLICELQEPQRDNYIDIMAAS